MSWVGIIMLSFGALLSFSSKSVSADSFGCHDLLMSDQTLIEALPDRIRNVLNNGRTVRWIRNRESAWIPFFEAMDKGLENEGKLFSARIDDLEIRMSFRRGRSHDLQLWIEYAGRDGLKTGQNSPNGMRFLDLIAAQLSWFSKHRKTLQLDRFEILAENLKNKRLVEFLKSSGFESRGMSLGNCAKPGAFGGAFVGGMHGLTLASDHDGGLIEAAIERAAIGGISVAAVLCATTQGKNYELLIQVQE